MENKPSFKVIIVGGGIAGLALANELQHAGVDFVVLEGRSVIDPQVGASIGMLPNGSRILDQMGCYDDILDLVEPIVMSNSFKRDGSKIGKPQDSAILLARRSAYSLCFLDRQWVLRILADHVEDKSSIQLNKRVNRIEQSEDKATVFCTDGSSFDGDVVVGADGVFSTVRYEMWRQAEEAGDGKRFEKDKQAMFSEYKCCFGISTKIEGMEVGNTYFTYDKDRSSLIIIGKNGRIFWFIFAKHDKIYKVPNIPKYTTEDKENFLKEHRDFIMNSTPLVTLSDFRKTEVSSTLVSLEEAAYENWTYGRLVCAGDAIHKMTPNLGAGGNSAIESTAIIANQMKRLSDQYKSSKPPASAVRNALETFVKLRHTRIVQTMEMANGLTRIEAMKGPLEKFVAYHIIPNAGDYMADMYGDFQVGAPLLEYLPPPPRSLEATMPFNEKQGWGFIESKAKRAFTALPFIGIAATFMRVLMTLGIEPHLEDVMKSGRLSNGTTTANVLEKFYPIPGLDSIWRLAEAFFMPSTLGFDPVAHAQGFPFLIDVSTLYAIVLIESSRRSNMLTTAQIPVVFGFLAQQLGGGFILPLYFFLLYTYSSIANFKASDNRLTNVVYTQTVFPLMVLFSFVPVYLMYNSSDLRQRQYWTMAWQMFPVWVSIAQNILTRTVLPDTMEKDRVYRPRVDVPAIRLTVGTFAILSAAVWIYTFVTSPFSMSEIFIPALKPGNDFYSLARYFMQVDEVAIFSSGLLWLAYSFGNLKAAGMMRQSWLTISALGGLSLICLGPGATFAAGWLWREENLIWKRHKSAVTKKFANPKLGDLDLDPKLRGKAVGIVTNGKATNGQTNGRSAR